MKHLVMAVVVWWCSIAATAWALPDQEVTREIRFGAGYEDVADTAQALGSAVRMYEYVRNELEYLPYYGVRANSVNTLWRKGGNDVDLAALLIAMLRSQGIRARYATGTITVSDDAFASWLGVANGLTAREIMSKAVIPPCTSPIPGSSACIDLNQSGRVSLPHAWVEALLPVANYRGIAAADTAAPCTGESVDCKWISLDPSFKAHQVTPPTIDALDATQGFDYTAYYDAIRARDDSRRNKSPADILQEAILAAHLGATPADLGATPADVLGTVSVIPVAAGILPGSLPYEVDAATVTRWVSAAEHDGLGYQDTRNCGTSPDAWTMCLTLQGWIRNGADVSQNRMLGEFKEALDTLAEPDNVLRAWIDDDDSCAPNEFACHRIWIDYLDRNHPGWYGNAADNEGYQLDAIISGVFGQYGFKTSLDEGNLYVPVLGGVETSPEQVSRAADMLISHLGGARVLPDATGFFIDKNANGVRDSGESINFPTHYFLNLAARLYAYEDGALSARVAALAGARKDFHFVVGFASYQATGKYIDGAPFAVVPSGLLLDVASVSTPPYRMVASGNCPNGSPGPRCDLDEVSKLLDHVGSSLEHEVWQQLTAFDAISTFRGFQKAIARGGSLVTVRSTADLPNLYGATGFGAVDFAKAGYDLNEFSRVTSERPVVLLRGPSAPTSEIRILKKAVDPTLAADPAKGIYTYPIVYSASAVPLAVDTATAQTFNNNARGICAAGSRINQSCTTDNTNATSGCPGATCPNCCVRSYSAAVSLPQAVACFAGWLNSVKCVDDNDFCDLDFALGGPHDVCLAKQFTGTVGALRNSIRAQWSWYKLQYGSYLCSYGLNVFGGGCLDITKFLDENRGFHRDAGFGAADFTYRYETGDPTLIHAGLIANIRDDFYGIIKPGNDAGPFLSAEFVVPSRRVVEIDSANHPISYQVYYGVKTYPDQHRSASAAIEQGFGANGGYVVGDETVADWIYSPSSEVVSFDNEYHSDQVLAADANNSWRSPYTGDPVSTATGNMFHDETDLTIPAQPFDLVFTRTYNSRLSRVVQRFNNRDIARTFWPLGPGWTHAYAMLLIPNNFGEHPNDPDARNGDGTPMNNDGVVSSVTFVDGRGGETNFTIVGGKCLPGSCPVKTPAGFFGTLTNPTSDTPSIEFPDGTRYGFRVILESMTSPNGVAVLETIEAADGRKLTINFGGLTGGRTSTITDALGRQVATLQHTDGRLTSLRDAANHTWTFGYDGGLPQRLTSVTDPLGRVTTYGYLIGPEPLAAGVAPDIALGAQYRLDEILHPPRTVGASTLQRSMAFDYYTNGWAASTTDALGNTESYMYDLFRRRTEVTDPRGFVRTYTNDGKGALQTLEEADGNVLGFKSTPDNLRYEKSDAYGRPTRYSYAANESLGTAANRAGNVTLERDPTGAANHFEWTTQTSASGRPVVSLTKSTDKNGNARTITYCTATDGAGCFKGNVSRITLGASTLLEHRTYFSDGTLKRVAEQIDQTNAARQRLTDHQYDGASHLRPDGKLISGATSGVPLQWRYGYDALGRLTSESLELGAGSTTRPPGVVRIKTQYGYDAVGRVTSVTGPDSIVRLTDYDEDGNPYRLRAQYPNGVTRTLVTRAYDAAGRKTSETDTLGNTTAWTYDAAGNVLTMTDANGHVTTYEYDAMGRRVRTVDANGRDVLTDYDAAGDVAGVTTAIGATVFERDALGRPTKTTSPLANSSVQGYDANGNVTSIKDAAVVKGERPGNAAGHSATTVYDELNRATQVTNATGGLTKFEYDLLGNRTAVVDALGQRTEFVYNDLGQLVTIRDSLLKTTTFTYDTAGQVATRTDRNGRVAYYVYDAANRLTGIDYSTTPGLDEERHYDAFGNLEWIRNPDVTYTYAYDALNRRTAQTDSRTGKSLAWAYDAVGNIIQKTGYEGDVTTYTYDSANRLVAMSNPEYLGATYHYDAAGRLLDRIFSNGTRTAFGYDADNRLTAIQHYNAGGSLVSQEQYCLDAVGNITRILRSSGATCAAPGADWTLYAYDGLYRLTTETESVSGTATLKASLTYDAVGNIRTATGDGDGAAPGRTYFYTAGNRLSNVTSTSGNVYVNFYDHDDEGNRTAKRDAAGTVIETYDYDAKNRLVALQVGAQVTTYTYDPFDYRIGVASGGEETLYALEGEHVEAIYDGRGQPKATFLRGAVIDEIVGAYAYDARGRKTFSTYGHDRLTSVTRLTDHTGAAVQTYAYGPFGADRGSTGTSPNRLKYTGREQDPTGLYYYRARYYDPATRRFLTEDPLGFDAGVNWYVYANNNPMLYTDPDGRIPLPLLTGGVGLVAGAAGSTVGQLIRNRGFANFNLSEVGVAAGVGFVAGALAPYTAFTYTGAIVTSASANLAQYYAVQYVNGQPHNAIDAVVSGVAGAVGGAIAGPIVRAGGTRYVETSPWIDQQVARELNRHMDYLANVGTSTLARNLSGSVASSTIPEVEWPVRADAYDGGDGNTGLWCSE